MDLVDVVLEGTEFNIVNVKRSPVTKKLLVHIDDNHSKDLSLLRPNKVKYMAFNHYSNELHLSLNMYQF